MYCYWLYRNLIPHKIEQEFFQAVAVSVLLNGCASWTLTKRMEKKLLKNATWYFHKILEVTFYEKTVVRPLIFHLTSNQRCTTYAWHFWRSKDELIRNFLQLNRTQKSNCIRRPAKRLIYQVCVDTWCHWKDIQSTMANRDWWRGNLDEDDKFCKSFWSSPFGNVWSNSLFYSWSHYQDLRPY